jgi:hypothetical protein
MFKVTVTVNGREAVVCEFSEVEEAQEFAARYTTWEETRVTIFDEFLQEYVLPKIVG